MAVIDPEGLFTGSRLSRLSRNARMAWPHLFLASNGYGRIELTNDGVMRPFLLFSDPPSKEEVEGWVKEYADNHLLFVYVAEGSVWGQWDCPPRLLDKYKTRADERSPAPDPEMYSAWQAEYRAETNGFIKIAENFQKFQKVSENLPLGIGIGIGTGIGKNLTSKPGGFDLTPEDHSKADGEKKYVREVWDYYISQIGRNPKLYSLTPKRLQMGVKRFQDSIKKTDDPVKAVRMMKYCVDAMRDSDFHNGKNEGEKKYLDWELLFRNTEMFEKWIERANQ